MKNGNKAVLFDLDGTLVYTIADITSALNTAIESVGAAPLSPEEGMNVIGMGLRSAIAQALALRGVSAEVEPLYKILMDFYLRHPSDLSTPYPGVVDFLSRLDCPIGVFSNKADELIQVIVKNLFPAIAFDFVLGMRDDMPKKPDPLGVEIFARKVRVPVSRVLYVGDSEVDWKLARRAGCRLVLVSWGYRAREELEKLEGAVICDTMEQLEERVDAV